MILVLGATGRVGRLVTRALLDAQAAVCAMARDPARAAASLGARIEVRRGEFGDPAGIEAACAGVERLFLMSPVCELQAEHQIAAVDAARRAGVSRIVKLSGSAWTMREGDLTATGAAHLTVERHLRASNLEFAIVRPNAFMHGALDRPLLALAAGESGTLALARGQARAGYIHIDDIGAVCAQALLAPAASCTAHEITGPQSMSGDDLAAEASLALGRVVSYEAVPVAHELDRLRRNGLSEFMLRHAQENLERMERGYAERVTGEVPRLLDRPARSARDFIVETLAGA